MASRFATVTVQELLSEGRRLLATGADPDTGQLDAELLTAFGLGEPRSRVLAHSEWPVPPRQRKRIRGLLAKRASGVPLAYLTGTQEFYGRQFIVRRGALVPRSDSETLVEAAIGELAKGDTVVDVGTGSGCLGLTLALERPQPTVELVDRSSRALAVAKRNAEALGAGNVAFHQADLWPAGLDARLVAAQSVVVANLPYLTDDEWLARPNLHHEPAGALRGGPDGLRVVRRFLKRLERLSFRPKSVLLEISPEQAEHVAGLARMAGRSFKIHHDLAGRERVVALYPPF